VSRIRGRALPLTAAGCCCKHLRERFVFRDTRRNRGPFFAFPANSTSHCDSKEAIDDQNCTFSACGCDISVSRVLHRQRIVLELVGERSISGSIVGAGTACVCRRRSGSDIEAALQKRLAARRPQRSTTISGGIPNASTRPMVTIRSGFPPMDFTRTARSR
jgi:hypothetical protein